MPLNIFKTTIEEIDGVRCTVVEKDATEDRVAFLKKLLEHNNYEVKVSGTEAEDGTTTFMIGVTDVTFNPVVDVYKRRLRSLTNHKVTPAYWLQWSDAETEAEVHYWSFKKPADK